MWIGSTCSKIAKNISQQKKKKKNQAKWMKSDGNFNGKERIRK